PMQTVELPGMQLYPLALESATSKFDLTLSLLEAQGELHIQAEYNTELFDATTMARMLDHWTRLLTGGLATPDCAIGLLPLLSLPERQQLLLEWNATQTPCSVELSLLDLFEAQRMQRPDAVAVVCGQAHLTYG